MARSDGVPSDEAFIRLVFSTPAEADAIVRRH